jgi:putative adhesin
METTARGFLLLIFLTVSTAAHSQDFSWRGTIAQGQVLEIKGINGSIIAERAAGSTVDVSATRRAHRSDPIQVHIEMLKTEAGITICAVYPGFGNSCKSGPGGGMNVRNNDVKVDFAVKVPDGVRLTARTVNGRVEALSLASDIEAYTVNGSVHVSSAGHAQASTVNGSIEATLGTFSKPAEFQTVNGGIAVTLPSGARANVEANTVSGGISTDFPLTIQGRLVGKSLNGTISGGGPLLALRTVNGGIQLRRASPDR